MPDLLEDAVFCLDSLARGEVPDHGRLVIGALALDTFCTWSGTDRDLLDAAAGLRVLATGGELDLDGVGRCRARQLTAVVRAVTGDRSDHDSLPSVSRASYFS
jgi:hypothetical protein